MGLDIHLDFSEVVTFMDSLDAQGADIVRQEMGAAMDEIGEDIHANAALGVPVDTGALKSSITRTSSGTFPGKVVEIGTPQEYGTAVEFGVRPGAHPGLNKRGLAAVALWFQRKRGLTAEDSQVAAVHFSAAIRKRGIPTTGRPPQSFLGPAVDKAEARADAAIGKAADRVTKRLANLGRR
jgi:hypothetical protein|tara:strand:+ start:2657 stop:3199 length:543 start_codon:yes stop_codon:yes gene_type:complete